MKNSPNSLLNVLLLLYLITLSGCVSNVAPENNQEFRTDITLKDLQGVYSNIGEPSGYLSKLLWGLDPEGQRQNLKYWIDKVEVIADNKTLTVKAVNSNCSVFEKRYVEGKDFTLNNGVIEVRQDTAILTRGGDDPLLGPSHERVTLGLDASGHGKSRDENFSAGLVYMLIPFAMTGTWDTRYERLSDTPEYYKPCE